MQWADHEPWVLGTVVGTLAVLLFLSINLGMGEYQKRLAVERQLHNLQAMTLHVDKGDQVWHLEGDEIYLITKARGE